MSDDYIFVLWAERFEEAPAAIFVTELRQRGLRVKVVGLHSHPSSGANGLTLLPDLTLNQALPLAGRASGIILSCALSDLKHLAYDPRLNQFFDQGRASKATFVIKQPGDSDCLDQTLLANGQVIPYPVVEELVDFARRLADALEFREK